MRTIRVRIALLAMVASSLLLAAVSVLMVSLLRGQLTENLDENLEQRADAISAALASKSFGVPPAFSADEDVLIQLVTRDGRVQALSSTAGREPLASTTPGFHSRRVPGHDESFRVLARPIDTAADGRATLLLAVNLDDVNDPVTITVRLLAAVLPFAVGALGLLTWWLTGRTLRPVDDMREQMSAMTGRDLDRRVVEPGSGDEIDRLAKTMNQTLDRLEDSLRRQQRFVADASHELRAPLTRIRSELEVDLAAPESADLLSTSRSVLTETATLERLVDDLLLLARSDAGAGTVRVERLDLDDVVAREARRVRDRGRVVVDTSGVEAVLVTGDRDQLSRAVRNLLENAERHARARVEVALVETAAGCRLTVTDDGSGVSANDRERIFDRFTRLDEARTRDGGGSGLGLAITRDIVTRHGGTIVLADGAPTRFVVDLPERAETR